MIKPLSAAISAVLLASAMSPAFAQDAGDAATNLDQVIVTGSRTPVAIEKVPGAVTLVTQEQVQRTLNLTEDATAVLARMVPGYSESSQAMSNSGETLRGRIALRLFDGVPQGSPLREGNRNGTFTDMGVIGRIEVINGPSAAEGIGGAGGVINYLSKNPEVDGHQTIISTRYGTQFKDNSDQSKIGVTHTFRGDATDFVISGAYIRFAVRFVQQEPLREGRLQLRRRPDAAHPGQLQQLPHRRQAQLHPGGRLPLRSSGVPEPDHQHRREGLHRRLAGRVQRFRAVRGEVHQCRFLRRRPER